MSRFQNAATGVVFSVDDSKDHRYTGPGFVDPDAEPDELEDDTLDEGDGQPDTDEPGDEDPGKSEEPATTKAPAKPASRNSKS